ncbi:MAG: nucleotidyltransferase domain-containing protein [Bacteroidota bacterium]
MNSVLKNNLSQVISLLKANHVKRAYAFGSVCTDKFNNDSDVDFLISFEENLDPLKQGGIYWILEEQLQKMLNHPIDLVAEHTLQNPYFINSINKTKTLLYE